MVHVIRWRRSSRVHSLAQEYLNFVIYLRVRIFLSVCENRVLRRILETKREEVTNGWRNLQNEEHCNLYFSTHIFMAMK
jgi:hypothetical protein